MPISSVLVVCSAAMPRDALLALERILRTKHESFQSILTGSVAAASIVSALNTSSVVAITSPEIGVGGGDEQAAKEAHYRFLDAIGPAIREGCDPAPMCVIVSGEPPRLEGNEVTARVRGHIQAADAAATAVGTLLAAAGGSTVASAEFEVRLHAKQTACSPLF
jgi:hypothetical protein